MYRPLSCTITLPFGVKLSYCLWSPELLFFHTHTSHVHLIWWLLALGLLTLCGGYLPSSGLVEFYLAHASEILKRAPMMFATTHLYVFIYLLHSLVFPHRLTLTNLPCRSERSYFDLELLASAAFMGKNYSSRNSVKNEFFPEKCWCWLASRVSREKR